MQWLGLFMAPLLPKWKARAHCWEALQVAGWVPYPEELLRGTHQDSGLQAGAWLWLGVGGNTSGGPYSSCPPSSRAGPLPSALHIRLYVRFHLQTALLLKERSEDAGLAFAEAACWGGWGGGQTRNSDGAVDA